MPPQRPDPLQQDLIRLVGGLAQRMRAHFAAVSAEFGLGAIEARALFLLDTPRAMSELAAGLQCDASYITLVADHLEAEGLVERQPDSDDRRVKRLVITPKGRRLRTEMQIRAEEGLPASDGLSIGQQKALRELLTTLADHAAATPEQPSR